MTVEQELRAATVETTALELEFNSSLIAFSAAAFRGDHKAIDEANERCINALQRRLDANVNLYRLQKKQLGF